MPFVRFAALCVVLLCGSLALADEPSLEGAEAAWNKGDVAGALGQWEALAARGDIVAANNLGYLYDNGVGVKQDPHKAVHWFRKVAEAGGAIGQYNLGNAYLKGRGVEQDVVEAAKWLTLAAAGGVQEARPVLAQLEARLTQEQLGEARFRAVQWRRDKQRSN